MVIVVTPTGLPEIVLTASSEGCCVVKLGVVVCETVTTVCVLIVVLGVDWLLNVVLIVVLIVVLGLDWVM